MVEDVKANPPSKDGDMVALYGKWEGVPAGMKLIYNVTVGLGQTSAGPEILGKLAETFLDVCME